MEVTMTSRFLFTISSSRFLFTISTRQIDEVAGREVEDDDARHKHGNLYGNINNLSIYQFIIDSF